MSLSLVVMGIDKTVRKLARKKAEMSGGRWRDEDRVKLFFISTLVFTVSLASKKKRTSCALSTPIVIRWRIFHSVENTVKSRIIEQCVM